MSTQSNPLDHPARPTWWFDAFVMIAAITLTVFVSAQPVRSTPLFIEVCDRAALTASDIHGVPLSVMRAITRTETGRSKDGKLYPWPWTVNMEGKGAWFESEQAARQFVSGHFHRGARSFDVGCFQINYRWHNQAFSSIDDMFDPQQNANYAAKFLRDLYVEFGSWERAVGAFHSRTPKYANRYIARFQSIHAELEAAPPPKLEIIQPDARQNTYPLIQNTAQPSRLGSLVPLGRGQAAFLPKVGG